MRSLGGGSHLKVIDVESSTSPERFSGGLYGAVCIGKLVLKAKRYNYVSELRTCYITGI